MYFVPETSRHQTDFATLHDQVAADNPVRLVDAFVDKLQLHKLGFTSTTHWIKKMDSAVIDYTAQFRDLTDKSIHLSTCEKKPYCFGWILAADHGLSFLRQWYFYCIAQLFLCELC